jgi:hypothetical protein
MGALFLAASACLMAAQAPADVEALKKGMPKDVASFIERTFECNHYGGEEPYDAGRAKQIERARKKLRCEDLPRDGKRLRKKYRNDPKVLKALDAADDLD